MIQQLKLIFFIFILMGCNSNSRNLSEGFTLAGKTNEMVDGEIIQLYDIELDMVIDSSVIKSNRFEFKGKLQNPPSEFIIRTKDISQYMFVWLENQNMTFDATKSDFSNAIFTGSTIHEWADKKLFQKLDSIYQNDSTQKGFIDSRELCLEFVSNNPNSVISASILSVYASAPQVPLERIKSLYKELSSENKQNAYGQRISETINTLESIDPTKTDLRIGDDFVDFEMMDTNGERVKLSENRGQFTLLEFWASNCGPCITEMPNLKRTYEEFNSDGFKIFAVSLDKSELKWKKSIKELSLDWVNVSDLNGSNNFAAMQYGVGGIPDNFLIDSNGRIIARNLRGDELSSELDKLLK